MIGLPFHGDGERGLTVKQGASVGRKQRASTGAERAAKPRLRLAGGLLMAAGLLVAAGCSGTGGTAQAEEEKPIPVQVVQAERGSLTVEEPLYGSLQPVRDAFVAPKLAGTLLSLEAGVNDRVEEGQRLAVIEHEQLEIQLRLQQLAAEQALDQYRNLQTSGAGDQQLEQALRSVEQARLNVRLAELNLANAFVTAPISGRVAEVNAEEGDLVSSGTPLFRITADERMTAKAGASARQRMLLEDATEVKVRVPDLGLEQTARITHVSRVPNGGFYAVEAELDNPDGLMVPGMAVTFVLEQVLAEDALLVPTAAIVEKGGVTRVFVVNGDRAEEVEVDVLDMQTDRTAVRGPLDEGSLIVTKGQLLLQDGAPVTIVGEGR